MGSMVVGPQVGSDPKTCCEPACRRYTCSPGWLPKSGVESLSKTGDEDCCVKSCQGYSCSAGLVPKKNSSESALLPGHDDDACCEPPVCHEIRNMTLAAGGCHAVSQDDCEKHYYKFDTASKTKVVECSYDAKLQICRNRGNETTGCHFD
ncbi:unnamed protein product [Effrenium voratum]|nr:unnamed protein product [Effrenium voratum]